MALVFPEISKFQARSKTSSPKKGVLLEGVLGGVEIQK